MTATEMHDLLRDAKAAIYQNQIWHAGDTEDFKHILYCRYCHYSQSHGHGDSCLIVRLEAAVPNGECVSDPARASRVRCMNGPTLICAGCGIQTTIYKPVCDDCMRAAGQTPMTCVFCLSGHYAIGANGLHFNAAGGYVGKCSDGVAKP